MNRISKFVIATMLAGAALAARTETPAETGVPAFAVARLSIAKMGVFLDQNGAFASQVVPNVGPLAKVALANILFKLPVDESLNFEGPVQIYVLAPLTFGATQETAMVLPVSDAVKLKANIVSVFGEPADQNGAMAFAVPQPLPLPDKTLFVKIARGKALLAPTPEVLKELEILAAAPDGKSTSDAELSVSVPALKKLYGDKVEEALQAGAFLASENVDGLKKVSDQLDAIIKTLWEIGTIELRLNFDKDSKNATAELAVAPLKGTHLADLFSNPPPGLQGRNSALCAAGAPVNAAFRVNGEAVYSFLRKYGLENPGATDHLTQAVLGLADGETMLAYDAAHAVLLQSKQGGSSAALTKEAEAIQQALVELTARVTRDAGGPPTNTSFVPVVETLDYKGMPITMRKIGSSETGAKTGPLVRDENGYFAHVSLNGTWIAAAGLKPEDALKKMIDRVRSNDTTGTEQKSAFDAPPAGTLFLLSAKLLAIVQGTAANFLPENVTPEQLTGGLADVPVTLSVFMVDGKAGLRATLPGATAGALYAVSARLRRHGISLQDLLGRLDGSRADTQTKVPGNVPAPPPEK